MNPDAFLRALWTDTPPGRIQLWRLRDKRTIYPASLTAADAVAAGQTDIYTCVALTSEGRAQNHVGRPAAGDALALAGMWLDIDIAGEGKTGGVPDITAALGVARLHAEPTLLVSTGHGIHAWHLFPQPWVFTSKEDQYHGARMAAQWQALHRHSIAPQGWTLDATHDLARLMRLPGTFNGKAGERIPVAGSAQVGPRHGRGALGVLCQHIDVDPASAAQPLERVTVAAGGRIDQGTLDLMLEDQDIYCTFTHLPERPGWTLSEYDLSLASQLAAAGVADQIIADMLVAHRAHHGEHEKAKRGGYLRLTIAKAKQPKAVAA